MPLRRVAPPILLLSAACAGADADAPAVERVDSAGIEHVLSGPDDRPLDWRFERVLTLGGVDEGPQAFGSVPAVGVDAQGLLYVPDASAHVVRVFDGSGALVREFGGGGGGPGEFEFIAAFAVSPDGRTAVFDIGKGGLVRFDASGEPLPEEKLSTFPSNRMRWLGDAIAGVFRTFRAEPGDTSFNRLLVMARVDTAVIASMPIETHGGMVQLPNCPIRLNVPPLLAPVIEWDGSGDRVVSSAGTEYAIDVWERSAGAWSPRRRIRRDLPPIEATIEIAAAENPDSFRIRGGTARCAIGPVEIAETLGYADIAPHVKDLALAPDGSLWVYRRVGTDSRTDVFDGTGAYNGTLPPGSPFPYAFRGTDEIVTIERDELDRQQVVVWRIVR